MPNAFLADPPLRRVVAATVEAGMRGMRGPLSWNAATYRSELDDDIQFVSSGGFASDAGYFRNVTRGADHCAEDCEPAADATTAQPPPA